VWRVEGDGRKAEATCTSLDQSLSHTMLSCYRDQVLPYGETASIETGVKHTDSNPLPPNTRSVTACTLPPFRCKFHNISRRLSCGNIWEICSTCAGLTRLAAPCRPEPGACVLSCPEAEDALRERYHRMARKPMKATMRSCGMLSVCSDIWKKRRGGGGD